jgi:hypothetical protein
VLVRLDENGELVPVNLADLRESIGQHIAGVRLVKNGTGRRREYVTYSFDTQSHRGPHV